MSSSLLLKKNTAGSSGGDGDRAFRASSSSSAAGGNNTARSNRSSASPSRRANRGGSAAAAAAAQSSPSAAAKSSRGDRNSAQNYNNGSNTARSNRSSASSPARTHRGTGSSSSGQRTHRGTHGSSSRGYRGSANTPGSPGRSSPRSRSNSPSKRQGRTGGLKNIISMRGILRLKTTARKIRQEARGETPSHTHAIYRGRLVVQFKGKDVLSLVVFRKGILTACVTERVKKVSSIGNTFYEWTTETTPIITVDCSHSSKSRLTLIPTNVKPFSMKVETSQGSMHLSCQGITEYNRWLSALQAIIPMKNRPFDMTKDCICIFCGTKKSTKYLPAPTNHYLPIPFALATDKACQECVTENDETRRREKAANVKKVERAIGEGKCNSQMKMWCSALPHKSLLPGGAHGSVDFYIKETIKMNENAGISIPAKRVERKIKAITDYRPVNGRLENDKRWRRTREANYQGRADAFEFDEQGEEGDEGDDGDDDDRTEA
jgi:hypothetical protein